MPKEPFTLSKAVRIITAPPIAALLALIILYAAKPDAFGSLGQLITMVFFLVAVPISAYPLQSLMKKYRQKGRDGQRNLALIMTFFGYLFGLLTAVLTKASKAVFFIYLVYFVSGLLIVLSSKVLHFKASGHACGVAGPIALLVYALGPWGLAGLVALVAVFISSLHLKRHTLKELFAGSFISCASFLVLLLLFRYPLT